MESERGIMHPDSGPVRPGEFHTGVELRPHERLMTHYLILAAFTIVLGLGIEQHLPSAKPAT